MVRALATAALMGVLAYASPGASTVTPVQEVVLGEEALARFRRAHPATAAADLGSDLVPGLLRGDTLQ